MTTEERVIKLRSKILNLIRCDRRVKSILLKSFPKLILANLMDTPVRQFLEIEKEVARLEKTVYPAGAMLRHTIVVTYQYDDPEVDQGEILKNKNCSFSNLVSITHSWEEV